MILNFIFQNLNIKLFFFFFFLNFNEQLIKYCFIKFNNKNINIFIYKNKTIILKKS